MFSYLLSPVVLIVFAIFYYRAGESEGSSGILWAGLSMGISLLLWVVLHYGLIMMLLGQIALFLGITIIRVARKS